MKKLPAKIIFIAVISFLSLQNTLAVGCDFKVDVTASNGGDGTENGGYWNDIGDVITAESNGTIGAGDVICFKRGQEFYTKINKTLHVAGTAGDPVVFTAYDSGDPPVLTMAVELPVSGETWAIFDGDVEVTNVSGSVGAHLWEDGRALPKASSTALTDGNWYRESGKVYYKPTDLSKEPEDFDVRFAHNSRLLDMSGLEHRVFDGIAFKYTAAAIYGRAKEVGPVGNTVTRAINNVTIINSDFVGVETPIWFQSKNVNGQAYEAHDINVSDNYFKEVRFALRVDSDNTALRSSNITIASNLVNNIELNAGYSYHHPSPDIEVMYLQNIENTIINNNMFLNGLKLGDDKENYQGEDLLSTAISIWVHGSATIDNVVIDSNYFNNLGRGIILGSGVSEKINSVLISNNIIANTEIGIRLNSGDANDASKIYNNTLDGNDVSIYLNSGGTGYQFYNNISSSPGDYHVVGAQTTADQSTFDNNLYVPDDMLFLYPLTDVYPIGTTRNFLSWQGAIGSDDDSLTSTSADYVTSTPNNAGDYKLKSTSPAISSGKFFTEVTHDYKLENARDATPNMGAHE